MQINIPCGSVRVLLVCAVAIATRSAAQTPAAPDANPVFEVADVHASLPVAHPSLRGGFIRGGRYDLRNATMVDLIAAAWGVDPDKVAGGPNWLDTDHFDVVAKGPADATPESLRLMLQALLADRFSLVVHNSVKPFPGYVLTAGKHPQLKPSAGGETGCQSPPHNAPTIAPNPPPYSTVSCRNMTMAEFAARLPRLAGNYFQLTPVVDKTGLTGAWDFTLKWTARGQLAAAGADGIPIHDAVEKQLGLKLDVQDIPLPVLVVDGVNEKPTPNLPGVSRSLPVTPTEFEAADIKPSAPDSAQRIFRLQPGGRIELRGIALRELIKFAWGFQDTDVLDNDQMVVGAPKWLETERYDIVAKTSSSVSANGGQVDEDSVQLMLRALLTDRFGLVTHFEDQPISVYVLTAAKPKLRPADPSNRPGCRNVPAPAGFFPLFSIRCRNTTMAELAAKLQPWGGIYVNRPVIDETGLAGAWDFVVSWSPPHLLQGAAGRAGEPGEPLDPNGALTLVEALEKQLGLRLELKKRPMPVLVVDRVEQKPTDN